MGTAIVKPMSHRSGKNSKSKAKSACRCLSCEKPTRETHEGRTLLICGDEACDLNCGACTERPISGCGFKPLPVVVEVFEGERMQA